MKHTSKIFLFLIFATLTNTFAQVGIGNTNPDATALIDINTTANDKGVLIPRVSIIDLSTIAPITGGTTESLLVYNTNITTGKGFHYWNGINRWIPLTSIERIDDLEDGKSDVDGSEDGSSIFLGIDAGTADDASDNRSVGIGYQSLQNSIGTTASPTIGEKNTAVGYQTMQDNTEGKNNTAMGMVAMQNNTTGKNNTAIGTNALKSNTAGDSNVAIGAFSSAKSITGINNVSVGNQSMRFNDSGELNVAVGDYSLRGSTATATGALGDPEGNVALGSQAQQSNESGDNNVAIGKSALNDNINGDGNVAIGNRAGFSETGSNKLYIHNSSSDATVALVYGEFDNSLFRINGDIETEGLKVGDTNGTLLTEIIKVTVNTDIPNIVSGNYQDVDFTVTGASGSGSVHILPNNALPRGVIISYAKIQGANNVRVRFFNAHSSDQDPNAMDFYITVIE